MLSTEQLETIQLKILDKRLGDIWPLPNYATDGSAGMDLRACLDKPVTLTPGETKLIPTGISIYIAEQKFAAKILPRSGLGHEHGIILGNGTGLNDSDYQGPLYVSCWNRATQAFTIQPGDRIAQILFIPIARPGLQIVDSFEATHRGEGGFGSTGISS